MTGRQGQMLVLVTAPDREIAEKIAHSVLERRLAACVNISPGWVSFYHWERKIEQAGEVLLLIKTREELLEPQLIPLIQQLHPYQVPEIIALEITAGERKYLDWIDRETGGNPGS